MKKIFLVLSLCFPLIAMAAQRSNSEVLTIVRGMKNTRSMMHQAPSFANPVIAERTPAYVAVNTSNGFVLVGADDRMPEVLGWTDKGAFDRNILPPALLMWLNEYEQEALQLDSICKVNPGYIKQRKISLNSSYFNDSQPILLSTKWHQNTPFNNKCPRSSSTDRCLTGCVATAIAQIMNYYKYPAHGYGSNSYKWLCGDCGSYYSDSVVLSADFENIAYDWQHMKNNYSGNYSGTEASAVATLMSHCGIAVNMDYGASASSAYTDAGPIALFKHFGYGVDIQSYRKEYFTMQTLMAIIHDELQKGHPILARGKDPQAGGHAFVCDGYNSNGYFHFNWGWGGTADGYFLLSALNPRWSNNGVDKYNEYVYFFTNIYPDSLNTSTPHCQFYCDSIQLVANTINRDGKLNVTAHQIRNYNPYTFVGRLGVMLSNADTKEPVGVYWNSDIIQEPFSWGWTERKNMRFSIPATVNNGTYLLDMVFRMEDDSIGAWEKAIYLGGAEYGAKIKISANQITRVYGSDTVPTIEFTNDGDTLTCAEAYSMMENVQEGTTLDQTNTVVGYVTNMEYDGIFRGQQLFGMNDISNGLSIFICRWGNVTEEIYVGDKVAVIGSLRRNNNKPEILMEMYSF